MSRRCIARLGVPAVVAFMVAAPLSVLPSDSAAAATGTAYQLSVLAGRVGVSSNSPAGTDSPEANGAAVDASGNVYIADGYGYIDKVTPAGVMTIIAGDGRPGGVPVPGPALRSPIDPGGIAVDRTGNLYVADSNGWVEKIDTTGTLSILGGDGHAPLRGIYPGQAATLSALSPTGVAVDSAGVVYLSDSSDQVFTITPDGILSLIAGNGAAPDATWDRTGMPSGAIGADGVAVDAAGNVFISTAAFVAKLSNGSLSLYAGALPYATAPSGTCQLTGPAIGCNVAPRGIAVDSVGNVDIVNRFSTYSSVTDTIQIAPNGTYSTLEGMGGAPNGTAAQAHRGTVSKGLAADGSGDVFIADQNGYIYKVTQAGAISTVAGTSAPTTPIPGPATQSPLQVNDVAYDPSGNLFIADGNGYVEKVTPSGTLSIVAGNGQSGTPVAGQATASPMSPDAVAVDNAGNLFISTRAEILKVTPAGALSIYAGGPVIKSDNSTPQPGPATSVAIDAAGVAVDGAGNVYLGERNGYIEKIDTNDNLTVIAGVGQDTINHPTQGPANTVAMSPVDIALDSAGNVFIANYMAGVTELSGGQVTRVAGYGNTPYLTNGPALGTSMDPSGVTVDSAGNLFINADGASVAEVTGGQLTVIGGYAKNGAGISGAPTPGWALDGPLWPMGIAVNFAGTVTVGAGTGDSGREQEVVGLTQALATLPDPPTAPVATAGSNGVDPGVGDAYVTFTAPYSSGGSPITAYTVAGGGHGCSPGTLQPYGNGTMSCVVTGLPAGTPVTFTVSATSAVGTSFTSAPSNSVTPYTTPDAPTGLKAVAGSGEVQLSWTAPTSDGWSPILGYSVTATDITIPGRGAGIPCPGSTSSTTTTCTSAGLTNGDTYTFAVAARNAAGTGPAATVTATPMAPPDAPLRVGAVPLNQAARIDWIVPGNGGSPIVGYTIRSSSGNTVTQVSGTAAPGATMDATVGGLTNGVAYTFTVTATNSMGTSAPSTPSPSVTPTVVNVPTRVAISGAHPYSMGTRRYYPIRVYLKTSSTPGGYVYLKVSGSPGVVKTYKVPANSATGVVVRVALTGKTGTLYIAAGYGGSPGFAPAAPYSFDPRILR